jgi:putative flippase GtrA
MTSLAWFVLVGISAAATHYTVVVALVSLAGWPPAGANLLGFAVAFWVSYFGHRRLTFATQEPPAHAQALPRFALVAAGSFALNQLAYMGLLRFSALSYQWALLLVLTGVALLTYITSRLWAFRSARA